MEDYASGLRDNHGLVRYVEDMRSLAADVETLRRQHAELWRAFYKPFGWEEVDGRYGRLVARMQTAAARVESLVSGQVTSLPELEAEVKGSMWNPFDR